MSNGCGNPPLVFMSQPCPRQHYKKSKPRRCTNQGSKKKMVCSDMNASNNNCPSPCGEKKKNFMEEMWKAMTPDLLNKLVDILVEEFNMSRQEACEFVRAQKELSKKSQKAAAGKCPCNDMAPAIPNIDVRNAMIKEFVEVTACKLSDYMSVMLCARKTRRQKVIAETMLDSMNAFLGPNVGTESTVGKVAAFLSQRLSLWLDNVFDDVCLEEEEKGGEAKENSKESTTDYESPAPPEPQPEPEDE